MDFFQNLADAYVLEKCLQTPYKTKHDQILIDVFILYFSITCVFFIEPPAGENKMCRLIQIFE